MDARYSNVQHICPSHYCLPKSVIILSIQQVAQVESVEESLNSSPPPTPPPNHQQALQFYFAKASWRCLFLCLLAATSLIHTIIISYLDPQNGLQLVSLSSVLLHTATSMISSKYKTVPVAPCFKALQLYFVALRINPHHWSQGGCIAEWLWTQALEPDCLGLNLSSIPD